jgi:hypothetical protein
VTKRRAKNAITIINVTATATVPAAAATKRHLPLLH